MSWAFLPAINALAQEFSLAIDAQHGSTPSRADPRKSAAITAIFQEHALREPLSCRSSAHRKAVEPTNPRRGRAQRSILRDRGLTREQAEKRKAEAARGERRSKVMARQTETSVIEMERAAIAGTSLEVSRVAIGTWAIGGWMWGGTDEAESIATIRAAVEHGINLIDTAPVYGFGRSEEIVGKAIAEGHLRSRVLIATKTGIEWSGGSVFRNASRARILQEVEDSLRRLRTDHIDVYQVHWPDPLVTIEETAEAMRTLFEQGKIRAIGVRQFLGRANGALPPDGAAPRAAAAL